MERDLWRLREPYLRLLLLGDEFNLLEFADRLGPDLPLGLLEAGEVIDDGFIGLGTVEYTGLTRRGRQRVLRLGRGRERMPKGAAKGRHRS